MAALPLFLCDLRISYTSQQRHTSPWDLFIQVLVATSLVLFTYSLHLL